MCGLSVSRFAPSLPAPASSSENTAQTSTGCRPVRGVADSADSADWVQAVWSEARRADRLDVTFPVTLVGAVAVSDASASAAPKSTTAKRGAMHGERAGGEEPCKKQRGSESETGLRPAPTVHVLSDDDDDFQ